MKIFLAIVSVFLFLSPLFATSQNEDNDVRYVLSYNAKDMNCTLSANGTKIPTFDSKFNQKPPRNAYTCFAIQKEQYNECHIVDKKNTTAVVFSYGVYDFTDLVVSFKTPTKHIDGHITVDCTKSLPKTSK